MDNEFFERAAQDPVLMREAVDALQGVLGGKSPSTPDGVRDVVRRAAQDPKLKADLAKAIRAVAVRHGLSFTPQETSPGELTDAELAAVAGGKDNPTQIPIGTPIALLFIAAALIFLPSIFKIAGGTLFAGGASGGVDGAVKF